MRLRVLSAAVLFIGLLGSALPADAASGGGARTTVTVNGDILTTVLFGTSSTSTRTRRRGTPAPAVRCTWSSLADGAVEWLLAVGSSAAGQGTFAGAFVNLLQAAGPDALLTQTAQAERCTGVATGRFRLVRTTASSSSLLTRTMLTRLPPPEPFVTPPLGVAVPVGEPVFVSFTAPHWQPVHTLLAVGTVVAEVEAIPVGYRVVPGDPHGRITSCDGSGVPYDPADQRSPLAQTGLPGRCASQFTAANDVSGRPAAWLGTVTVLWSARWRIIGRSWRSLGLIPRTRVLVRSVRQVTTAIETTRG